MSRLAAAWTVSRFVRAYQRLWGPQDVVSHHRRRYGRRRSHGFCGPLAFIITRMTHANLLLLPLVYCGRAYLRLRNRFETENRLHPRWANDPLPSIFLAERHLLARGNLPMGVSLLCVATAAREPSHPRTNHHPPRRADALDRCPRGHWRPIYSRGGGDDAGSVEDSCPATKESGRAIVICVQRLVSARTERMRVSDPTAAPIDTSGKASVQ